MNEICCNLEISWVVFMSNRANNSRFFYLFICLLEKFKVSQGDISKLSQNTTLSVRINQNGEISQVVVY